jgi:tetratricopeptide (TPR) repeat protein
MSNDDWFRGEDWDEEFFEGKIKRSRTAYNKSQYLRIKGSYMLSSDIIEKQKIGVKLMLRVIGDYPEELYNTKDAFYQLGVYYTENEEYEKAEYNYRECIRVNQLNDDKSTRYIALAELIIGTKQYDKYLEIFEMLTNEFERTDMSLLFSSDKFRFARCKAIILYKIGNSIEYVNEFGKEYAEKALRIFENTSNEFEEYHKVGHVITNEDEILELKRIADK